MCPGRACSGRSWHEILASNRGIAVRPPKANQAHANPKKCRLFSDVFVVPQKLSKATVQQPRFKLFPLWPPRTVASACVFTSARVCAYTSLSGPTEVGTRSHLTNRGAIQFFFCLAKCNMLERAVLIDQRFPKFALFFPKKNRKIRKKNPNFGNLTEGKISGTLTALKYLEEKKRKIWKSKKKKREKVYGSLGENPSMRTPLRPLLLPCACITQ